MSSPAEAALAMAMSAAGTVAATAALAALAAAALATAADTSRRRHACGDLSGKVVGLNRSVYGLKQASRSWHEHLITRLKES